MEFVKPHCVLKGVGLRDTLGFAVDGGMGPVIGIACGWTAF